MKKLLALGLLLVAPALAQLDRGQIVGSVTDETGAVIPEVRITIRNSATGATYETVSNENGQYARPNLPVGPYIVTAEKEGLKRLDRSGIQLKATEVLRVDLTLEVGSVTESVQVTASRSAHPERQPRNRHDAG